MIAVCGERSLRNKFERKVALAQVGEHVEQCAHTQDARIEVIALGMDECE